MSIDTFGNILVIENQQYECELIIQRIQSRAASVYPSVDGKNKINQQEFTQLMNWVHIILNEQYDQHYRKLVKEQFTQFVNKSSFNLILMDHILCGAHYCHTGIDLAHFLNKGRTPVIPVVFLSSTKRNDRAIFWTEGDLPEPLEKKIGYEGGYDKMYPKQCDWLYKGYLGDRCLDKDYFDDVVLTRIDKVIKNSAEKATGDKIYRIVEGVVLRDGQALENGLYSNEGVELIQKLKDILTAYSKGDIKVFLPDFVTLFSKPPASVSALMAQAQTPTKSQWTAITSKKGE